MKKKRENDSKQSKPISKKEEIRKNPDKHINQDFPGYPHHPSKEKTIKSANTDEQNSDGSAGAFEETEELKDE